MKFSFFIPFFIILLSINILIFNQDFYQKEMPQYQEYETELLNLLQYFKGEELNTENYSEKEIFHLKDVRKLMWVSFIITTLLSLLLIILITKNSQRKKEFLLGGVYTCILLILLIIVLLTFSTSFIAFHKIFFTNNLWLLPANSLLIQMFPERFFIESLKQIILYSFTLSLLSIIIGVFLQEKKHDKRT
ncbi:MAG: DUF1461 domain-containing protein [bacterium]|nr:DUF1461 domain-containing protein [bacterium]